MKRKILLNSIKLLITVIFIMAVLIIPVKAYASSADISFSSDVTEAVVGDTVTVYLTIKADVLPGSFEGYISYDSDVFEYREGPSCITGAEGLLKVTDLVTDSTMNTRRYSLTFEAVGRGECEFSLLGAPELYEFEEGYLMSVASSPLVIQVEPQSTASSDTALDDLRVSPGTLSPEFNENVFEYNVSVETLVERLIVSAHARDLTATVTVSGGDALNIGQNRITVTVTAQNGDEQRYIIYCVRQEGEVTPEPDEQAEPTPAESEQPVALREVDGELYIYGKYEYHVCAIPEGFNVPEGYVETAVVLDGKSVTAYVREDKPDDDFLLMLLEYNGGEVNLYCYDRVEKTIQRYASGTLVNQIIVTRPTVTVPVSETDSEQTQEYESRLTGLVLAVVALCAVCALLLIFVIRLFMKNKGIKSDELDN